MQKADILAHAYVRSCGRGLGNSSAQRANSAGYKAVVI
jgi:hypothetical protein